MNQGGWGLLVERERADIETEQAFLPQPPEHASTSSASTRSNAASANGSGSPGTSRVMSSRPNVSTSARCSSHQGGITASTSPEIEQAQAAVGRSRAQFRENGADQAISLGEVRPER